MSDHDLTTIGGRLKYAREAREESIEDCASRMPVLSSTWGVWEEVGIEVAPKSMRPTILRACARILDCTVEWLRDGIGEPPKKNPEANKARREAAAQRVFELFQNTDELLGTDFVTGTRH